MFPELPPQLWFPLDPAFEEFALLASSLRQPRQSSFGVDKQRSKPFLLGPVEHLGRQVSLQHSRELAAELGVVLVFLQERVYMSSEGLNHGRCLLLEFF